LNPLLASPSAVLALLVWSHARVRDKPWARQRVPLASVALERRVERAAQATPLALD